MNRENIPASSDLEQKSRRFLNADCMEVMKKYPDKHFDLAIVDPPYGINICAELAKRGQTCGSFREWDSKDWDAKTPDDNYFVELRRVSKNQIIWGGNYFGLPPSRCWFVWDKKQRNFSFADCELAWTSFNKSARVFEFTRSQLLQENKIHPTQKPVDLYLWLLKNNAKKGDLILDTHVGSASSLIACEELGFNYVACELDEDYYEKANKRLNNYRDQLNLFAFDNV